MRFTFLTLFGLAAANTYNINLEHAGQLFSKVTNPSCLSGVLHTTNSTGQYKSINGTNRTDNAILYLTDIFGLPLVNNRLLGDSLAKAGYLVVMPDLFSGDAIPIDYMTSGFNMTAWRQRHPDAAVESIIKSTIQYIRSTGVKKLGAVGYCFGGRYVARLLAGDDLDAGFAAHPSGVQLPEWQAVKRPLSIAYGALDASNNATQRATAEAILQSRNLTYQTSLYANAEHGFAVRTNLSIPQKAFAQEAAYFQAVRWLNAWMNSTTS